MPPEVEHLAQVERNERLYSSLRSPSTPEEFTEWEVVALFYAALHYVDAYLARTFGEHPRSHRERNLRIAQIANFSSFAPYYRHLYNHSRSARYDLVPYTISDIRNLENDHFLPIKQQVRSLLGIT